MSTKQLVLKTLVGALVVPAFFSCQREVPVPDWDQSPYTLDYGDLPTPQIPGDNALTEQGVKLGRMLFYENRLSGDNTQNCASCHRQEHAFSDTARFSIGIHGMPGHRQAMSVGNMLWNTNGFFWDGRAADLRTQSLMPIQDPLEMDASLVDVVEKLAQDTLYTHQFARAFGTTEITPHRISLALEQFMNSLISYRSKYDAYLAGNATLTDAEERGRELFFTEYNPFFPEISGADCAHCHSGKNFNSPDYMNNGLDSVYADNGYFQVTGQESDRGKMKVTTLRNIALTPPYMHDGRFQTLEEVVAHYNEGLANHPNLDPALAMTRDTGLMLTEQDQADLVAFLHTLTDYEFISDARYTSPF